MLMDIITSACFAVLSISDQEDVGMLLSCDNRDQLLAVFRGKSLASFDEAPGSPDG